MGSEIDLMNAALAHLGEEIQLSDPDADPAPRAQRVFRALLPTIRDAMLREHPWLCAERRLTVTRQPGDDPVDWKFRNVFLLPRETLRVWSVETEEIWQAGFLAIRDGDGAVIERRKALFSASAGPLNVTIIDTIPYEDMDALLFDAMGYELAKRAAGPLQADKALAQRLKGEAREALALAVTTETSEWREEPALSRGRFLGSR